MVHETNAIKFQRFVHGVGLLIALIFGWMPPVYLLFAILMISFIKQSLNPFGMIYKRLSKPREVSEAEGDICTIDYAAERFACGLAALFISIAIVLHYYNYVNIAWAVVAIVAALSLLAGTVGFCLGSVIYYAIKNMLKR